MNCLYASILVVNTITYNDFITVVSLLISFWIEISLFFYHKYFFDLRKYDNLSLKKINT